VAFLAAATFSDVNSSIWAVGLLAVSVPVYLLMRHRIAGS
jgi:hypothetical protein